MAGVVKRFFALGVVLLILGSFQIILWIAFPKTGGLKNIKKPLGSDPDLTQGLKTILLYTAFFGSETWDLDEGREAFQKLGCEVQDCFLTNDRRLFENVSMFDSILFHLGNVDEVDHEDFYAKRSANQKFVMFYLETPFSLPSNVWDVKLKNFFNWTMTYRTDSDVFSPYGFVQPKTETLDVDALQSIFDPDKLPGNLKSASERPGLVLWFVSNCHSNSLREAYVMELQKYIQVDIYGSCGMPGCERGSDCDRNAYNKYKFYLSFENALCSDYVTEKLFSILSKDIVPIVLGGANYADIVPPHSVIDAKEFPNPQDLADYLLELDDNPDKYLEYFWWKDHYLVSQYSSWISLKSLILGLVLFSWAPFNEALFNKGGGRSRPRVHCTTHYETTYVTIYETIYQPKCSTTYEDKCSTTYETEYETTYEQQCSLSYSNECNTVYDTSYKSECETKYIQKCTPTTNTVYEEQCLTSSKTVCDQSGGGGGGSGYDDPYSYESSYGAPQKPVCRSIPTQSCKQVPKQVHEQSCSNVPQQDCHKVPVQVPRQDCKQVPHQNCQQVPKQVPKQVPRQSCRKVPRESCHDVAVQVPKQVPQQTPRQICSGYGSGGGGGKGGFGGGKGFGGGSSGGYGPPSYGYGYH